LDLRLFNRTTRSVALTEAGERLLARIAPAFQDIDAALDDLNAGIVNLSE
jgi:DNA-binding transcriptional LysR family regulator